MRRRASSPCAQLGRHRRPMDGRSPEVSELLRERQRDLEATWAERFLEVAGAIQRQAAVLERMQRTMEVLVEAVKPELSGKAPVAIRVAAADERPDLASPVVVADPIGAGYTLSQADIARSLGIIQPDASILIRHMKLNQESHVAVAVRWGAGRGDVVNYRPVATEQLRAWICEDHSGLPQTVARAVERARRVVTPGAPRASTARLRPHLSGRVCVADL